MSIFAISSFFLLLSEVSWVCGVQTVRGFVGGNINIICKFDELEFHIQSVLLQKMAVSEDVTLIESAKDGEAVMKGRYSLYYDSSIRNITATIHNLSTEDAGTYTCVFAGYEDYDEYYTESVNLEVEQPPPPSKRPQTTGNTSAQSTVTGNTHQPNKIGATNTDKQHPTSDSVNIPALFGGLGAALLVIGLLVLTIILLKKRTKRIETSQSTVMNQRDLEESNGIYAEIEEADSSADKLQTPLTSTNQNQQNSSPVTSIYTTANYSPEELPASSQAINEISGATTTETENPSSFPVYSVVTKPTEMPAANQNPEVNGIYSLAVDPVQPTDTSDKQDSPINDT